MRVWRLEPGKPGHKLRGSWPSLPPRCRGPPSLRWRPRRSTFAPGRGQTPLATPRPYSTPGSPLRPLPAGPAQPLAPPRPTARSRAQQVPRTRPPPPRPGQSRGAWFPPPAAPRPRIHVLLHHPTRPGPGSARAQATGVSGSVRCTATHPALAWVPAWPAACARLAGPGARSGSGSRCRPRSPRRCRVSPRGLGPRKIRTRAGWGPRKASFFIFPPPPPQGRAIPHPPRRPLHLGRAPRPLSQLCSSPRRRGSGRSERRREVAGGAGIRPLGSGRTRGGGGEGGGGRGGGPAVLGAPPASPGEAGTSPGSHRPRTGHGGRTEPPFPASPQLQEGGGGEQRLSGSESERFRWCFMCDSLSPFSLRVWGGVGSCMRGAPPPDAPPLPWPPTSLTRATSVQGSGARALRPPVGAAPAPVPKWDRCWGRENAGARCLA